MDRPKIEDYFTSKRYETANKFGYNITFDSGLYEQALNSYIDQLEKALDKACKELEKCEKDFDKIYGTSYAKIKNKKYWKKELMKDD